MTNRRVFMMTMAAGPAAIAASAALAQAKPLDPKDPQAVALGYVVDTTKADNKKFPTHQATQHCGICQLYSGKPGATEGPCSLFQGRLVHVNGWCSAWVKKA